MKPGKIPAALRDAWGGREVERQTAINTFLDRHATDVREVCDFIGGPYGGGSELRPHLVVRWADAIEGEDAGRTFWSVVRGCWPSFDRVPHEAFVRLFAKFAAQWTSTDEIGRLPQRMAVYRGQSGDAQPGLSWTLSRSVADGFARGHRGIAVPNGVTLERIISREDVALAFLDDRSEQEVVLWAM